MHKNQPGYTIIEMLFGIIAIAAGAAVVGVLYVLIHFINKFW